MTEQDIRGYVLALEGSIMEQDGETAAECALELLESYRITQVRIAEALEDIRQWGVGQSKRGA